MIGKAKLCAILVTTSAVGTVCGRNCDGNECTWVFSFFCSALGREIWPFQTQKLRCELICRRSADEPTQQSQGQDRLHTRSAPNQARNVWQDFFQNSKKVRLTKSLTNDMPLRQTKSAVPIDLMEKWQKTSPSKLTQ